MIKLMTKINSKSILQRIPAAVLLFIAIGILFAMTSPKFLSLINLKNILLQSSPLAILSLGMSFVMLTNGIDLSVGSVVSFVSIITGKLLSMGFNIILSIFIGILAGSVIGIFNGIIISKVKLPPFIVTLGTMGISAGLALVLCGGETLYWKKNWFNAVALKYFLGIPVTFWIVLLIFAFILWVVHKSSFGIYVYGIGSNEEALRLCGVKVNFYKAIVYLINGCFAGIVGIIITSRIASGNPIIGIGFEFEAIAAAAIGGISFFGGKGHPGFALLSAVTITMLMNGLGLLGFGMAWQYCAIGIILIIGMSINILLEKIALKQKDS